MIKYHSDEVLLVLNEELHEAGFAICKSLRFGNESTWDGKTNKERLVQELGDVIAMIEMLVDSTEYGITMEDLRKARQIKKAKVVQFLHKI